MATQRSRVPSAARRTRTGARGGKTAVRVAQQSNNTMMIVGGLAAAAALVVVISFAVGAGGGADKPADAKTKPVGAEQNVERPPDRKPAPISLDAEGRPGTPPKRPAPTIDPARLARAEALYQASKQKFNDATRARSAGDTAESAQLMRDAWADIEKLNAEIEAYDDWYNEADFEGWEIPGAFVAYGKRLTVWDKHTAKVQKLKTR